LTVKLTDSVLREIRFFTSKTVGQKSPCLTVTLLYGLFDRKGVKRRKAWAEERKVRKIFRGGAAK
jgi:hypothetical protein